MKKALLFSSLLILAQTALSQDTRQIRQCLIKDGVIAEVDGEYDLSTGKKTVKLNGNVVDFDKLEATKDYASQQTWFINNEELTINGIKFVKYGLPRVLGVNEIEKAATYKGVGVYIEAGMKTIGEVIYLPVRPGCEFQPYQKKIIPCGTVKITPQIKTIKKGKTITFTANVTEAKGKLNYTWTAYSSEIVGDAKKKSVVVSTKNSAEEIEVRVRITGADCESNKYIIVKVEN